MHRCKMARLLPSEYGYSEVRKYGLKCSECKLFLNKEGVWTKLGGPIVRGPARFVYEYNRPGPCRGLFSITPAELHSTGTLTIQSTIYCGLQ